MAASLIEMAQRRRIQRAESMVRVLRGTASRRWSSALPSAPSLEERDR
jgi:hypothetical protein